MPTLRTDRNRQQKPWKARVKIRMKERFLGYFATKEEASLVENEFRAKKGLPLRNGRYTLHASPLGKAHWSYDSEFDMHLPCCSQLKDDGKWCFNGPLVGEQIVTGDCGEHQ